MGSADFSQFVVTTADVTACETSPLKVRTLSLHVPATFTGTSSNFWTSAFPAALSVFPSLICGFCPSGQRFAYSFLQIPPHDGHPCCSAMCFVVAYAHSGLSPVRARPWRANWQNQPAKCGLIFHMRFTAHIYKQERLFAVFYGQVHIIRFLAVEKRDDDLYPFICTGIILQCIIGGIFIV